jgi:hypothetical protein
VSILASLMALTLVASCGTSNGSTESVDSGTSDGSVVLQWRVWFEQRFGLGEQLRFE